MDEPHIALIQDGVYLPYAARQSWGLFNQDGHAIRSAIDFREGVHPPPDQTLSPQVPVAHITERAPSGMYIYGGRINPHFGHFLINTLPRFWSITRSRSPNTPILCHGPGQPAGWFRVPFIATIFELLGLTPSDFVSFDNPVRLRRVVIPYTSIEEQRAGYSAYRTLCKSIGDRICQNRNVEVDPRPIYYSKSKMKSAVGVITNEAEMESILRDAGVLIVYPEQLSFIDQVTMMRSHPHVTGSSGSFLHTSIFCPPRNIVCLNVTEQINSNYLIIDKLAGNTSAYFYPPSLRVLEKTEGYLTARYLPEAAAVARELVELLQQQA